MSDNVRLLRVTNSCRTVDEVLGVAARLDLDNVILISETPDGAVVLLTTDNVTLASANWLLDRVKMLLLKDTVK